MTAKSVILVHGAWADGSSWSKVILELAAEGLSVTAIQMPLTSFGDDVATLRRALALVEGPVILVGHSYGGSVITEGGNDKKVAALVFIAAFAPDSDESAASLGETVDTPPMAAEVRPDSSGFLKLTESGIRDHFARDLSDSEKTVLFAAQAPTAVASLTGKITEPAWQSRPSWYLLATEDHAIAPKLQHIMSSRIMAKVTEVASSHVAMLSHPDLATRLILEAVRAV
ncbi:alpha/beta hydrolase [Mesorhizobium sp. B2-4-15]|uniref:alpha/beta hydrolase n=1 Tax=Mesorhizobium sp. B2-4-15 TaxID=2589934 RepID=UPI001153D498|nr:alpha/beta hydrolase [Mesorhizobium sp. B2-4-15]TPK69733.1 alpha/beta hydrolase [Mesorhizobium sp. B2-4-15]